MWKVKTVEWAPFYCTLLVFTRSDGKYFESPIIVHQAKWYYQDLHFNIPLEWIFYHTPSGCMDIYGWIKPITQFSTVCSDSTIKNKTNFFDLQYSHVYDRTLRYTEDQNVQPFILKAVGYGNDQPNNIGMNEKLKSLLNDAKASWMMNYGETFF